MATNGRVVNLPAELEAWRLANDKTFDELADAIAAVTGRRRNSDCWRRVCLGQTKHPHERTLNMLTTFLAAAAAGKAKKRKALRKAS